MIVTAQPPQDATNPADSVAQDGPDTHRANQAQIDDADDYEYALRNAVG